MASNICKPSRRDHLLIKPTKCASKPTLLLKDYLRDDLSSCSSSGFKSFPRRQCCTTVGFINEKDIKLQRKKRSTSTTLPRQRPAVTALQRVSGVVITAIQSLSSQKSGKSKKATQNLLSRSFSRKLLSRRFWRKAGKEEGREGVLRCRRSFRELLILERDHKPTSFDEDTVFTPKSITTVSSCCCSNSWGESEFTFASNATSSDSSTENDLVDGVKDGAPLQRKIEAVTHGDWSNEKEQFSPVSILDCPFEDEEEMKSSFMINSFFQGAENKHMQKTRHFENLSSIEPLVLEKRMKCLELEDEPHNYSSKQCSLSVIESIIGDNKNKDELNSLMINTEKLLFDYLEQRIEENNNADYSKTLNLCNVVDDWMRGKPREPYLGWEVKEGRHVYISEMERCEEWRNYGQETEQLVLELENDVLTNLVYEIVVDIVIS